jgi:26S proteasome regulatory subunit N8
VEHLLRDINDPSTGTLALQIQQKVTGLKGLLARLQEIRTYLDKVAAGKMPNNNQITYNLQNIFNLLPNLNVGELVQSMFVKTNDMHLVMYVSALVRAILALHGLLVNKIKYRDVDAVLDREAGVIPAGASSEEKSGADKDKDSAKEDKEENNKEGDAASSGGAGTEHKDGK